MFLRAQRILAAMALVLGSAVASEAQVQSYGIKPGDKLRVEVLEDSSLNRDILVLPDGRVSFPLVGSLPAQGRSVDQVSASLRNALAPNFASPPTVHVSIASLSKAEAAAAIVATQDIFVLGEVGDPGRKAVAEGRTLLQFLAVAGGLGRFAADKRIELLRTNTETGQITTYLFNYRQPQGSASTISGSTALQPGDVVRVPQKRLFE